MHLQMHLKMYLYLYLYLHLQHTLPHPDLCLAQCVWQQLASDNILWQGLCR